MSFVKKIFFINVQIWIIPARADFASLNLKSNVYSQLSMTRYIKHIYILFTQQNERQIGRDNLDETPLIAKDNKNRKP